MAMNRTVKTKVAVVCAVASAALVVGVTMVGALHRDTPVFVQVTNQASGQISATASYTPEFWAFVSSGDVLGNGNSSPNLFVLDLEQRVLQGLSGITQATFGPVNVSSPSVSKRGSFTVPRDPVVVFEADGDLCATAGNTCDGLFTVLPGRQIFLFDVPSGKLRQVTRINGDARNPHVSGHGRSLLFDSTTDFLGGGGTGVIPELYQGDLSRVGNTCPQLPCPSGGSLAGVTKLTNGGGAHGSQSFNGQVVAFESAGDLANGGANPGTTHVYSRKGTKLKQITTGSGLAARRPAVSQNGKFIAFEWDRQPVTGPPVSQLFVAKVRSQTVAMTQVTDGASGSHEPSIDPKARRVSFVSDADLLNIGSTNRQVFVYNIRRRELLQVSGGATGADFASQTTAALIGFGSAGDFTGIGNTVPQFFVANTFQQAPNDFRTPTPTRTPTVTPTPTPTVTPTNTPRPGDPANVGLALLVDLAADNGNDTLVTLIAATISDIFGNPVPDGTFVNFQVLDPTLGAVVTNGFTNQDPDPACNIAEFTAATGQQITNQPGVANACVIYPRSQVGTTRSIRAVAQNEYSDGEVTDVFTLPPQAPTPTLTPTPTQTPTVTPTP
jgi:Tol biopolymer transport system component